VQGAASDQLSGFAIWINEQNMWEAALGIANLPKPLLVTGPLVKFETTAYIVLTFDGVTAKLFVNGESPSSADATGFVPNTTQPLVMAAGFKRVADREDNDLTKEPRFPLFPFKGTLQCVAIYATDISTMGAIAKHFHDGQGLKDEENA
jgi:hypothetical protein